MPATTTLRLVRSADATLVMPAPVVRRDHAAGEPPSWMRVGTHHVIDEFKLYFRTLWAFARHPMATAEAWANGRYQALNPFNFLLKTLAVVAPWRAFWLSRFKLTGDGLAQTMNQSFGAYFFLLLVTIAHPGFRIVGSKRTIGSSWAASMYVLGGAVTFLSLVMEPLALWSRKALGGGERSHYSISLPGFVVTYFPSGGLAQHAAAIATIVLFVTYWAYMIWALAGVHGVSRRRAALVLGGTVTTLVALIDVLSPVLTALGVIRHS